MAKYKVSGTITAFCEADARNNFGKDGRGGWVIESAEEIIPEWTLIYESEHWPQGEILMLPRDSYEMKWEVVPTLHKQVVRVHVRIRS